MIKQHKEFSCGAVGSLTGVVNAVTQVTAGCKFDPWPGNVHVPWVQPKVAFTVRFLEDNL